MSLSFQFLKTVAQREGSTRPLALIRIGIVLLLWNKFGKDIGVFAAENASYLMISLLFFLFSTLTLIGFRTRAAAAGLFFTVFLIYHFYGFVLDHWEWTHHHVYMLMFGCFVLMISPCGRSYSVDRYLRIRRAAQKGENPPAERGALWAQSLIPLQMSALYFWAAYDKTIPAYFKGEWLERVLEWGYA
ncbi:MAG: HTTM domain-containing protein, partial [Pseudomonadota bacterium]